MAEGTYSLSDIAALMGNRSGDGFLEGNGIIILILFFLIFGFGGGAFGGGAWGAGANGAFTRAEMAQGFADNQVMNKLNGIENGLCSGFYAQNTTMLNGFNTMAQEIANSRFAAQQCCCETNRNIDAVRSDNYRNTCEITTAIHKEGEETRALINANTMQNLRDKLADRDRDLIAANAQISQLSQTSNLINTLRPFPQPAYITCSPYVSQTPCGYGCGCGF